MSKESCYHSFDTLLLIDWLKANKGDLTVLRISGGDEAGDIQAWQDINDSHSEMLGGDSKHRAYFRLLKKLMVLKLDLIITGDRFLQNNIEIVQEEIDALLKSMQGGESNISEVLIGLSEKAGYMITESNITAKRFFEMVKYYGKKSK